MRNLSIFFVLFFSFLNFIASQKVTGPIMAYGNHPKDQVWDFINSNTDTASQYRTNIVKKIQNVLKDTLNISEANLLWIFQNIDPTPVRISLKEKTYKNSRWNSATKKMEYFWGKDFTGLVYQFHIGSYHVTMWKDTCVNDLQVIAEMQPKKNGGLIDEDGEAGGGETGIAGNGTGTGGGTKGTGNVVNSYNTTINNYGGAPKDTTPSKILSEFDDFAYNGYGGQPVVVIDNRSTVWDALLGHFVSYSAPYVVSSVYGRGAGMLYDEAPAIYGYDALGRKILTNPWRGKGYDKRFR